MDAKRHSPVDRQSQERAAELRKKSWSKPVVKQVSVKDLVRGIETGGPGDARGKRS